jgi:hypothetical protein
MKETLIRLAIEESSFRTEYSMEPEIFEKLLTLVEPAFQWPKGLRLFLQLLVLQHIDIVLGGGRILESIGNTTAYDNIHDVVTENHACKNWKKC